MTTVQNIAKKPATANGFHKYAKRQTKTHPFNIKEYGIDYSTQRNVGVKLTGADGQTKTHTTKIRGSKPTLHERVETDPTTQAYKKETKTRMDAIRRKPEEFVHGQLEVLKHAVENGIPLSKGQEKAPKIYGGVIQGNNLVGKTVVFNEAKVNEIIQNKKHIKALTVERNAAEQHLETQKTNLQEKKQGIINAYFDDEDKRVNKAQDDSNHNIIVDLNGKRTKVIDKLEEEKQRLQEAEKNLATYTNNKEFQETVSKSKANIQNLEKKLKTAEDNLLESITNLPENRTVAGDIETHEGAIKKAKKQLKDANAHHDGQRETHANLYKTKTDATKVAKPPAENPQEPAPVNAPVHTEPNNNNNQANFVEPPKELNNLLTKFGEDAEVQKKIAEAEFEIKNDNGEVTHTCTAEELRTAKLTEKQWEQVHEEVNRIIPWHKHFLSALSPYGINDKGERAITFWQTAKTAGIAAAFLALISNFFGQNNNNQPARQLG